MRKLIAKAIELWSFRRNEVMHSLYYECNSENKEIEFPSRWKRLVYRINHDTLKEWYGVVPRGYFEAISEVTGKLSKFHYPASDKHNMFVLNEWILTPSGMEWWREDHYCSKCCYREKKLTLECECEDRGEEKSYFDFKEDFDFSQVQG
mgnify:CR=1 FL=1